MAEQNQSDILVQRKPNDVTSPVVDLTHGGQNGFMGTPQEWNSNGLYVQQPIRPFLLQPPALMQWADNPQKEIDTLIAMIELWPIKIDGLDQTLTVENGASTPMGAAGEIFEATTNVSRAPSKPSFGYGPDRLNQSVTRYWTEFVRMYIMDPDLKVAGIVQKQKYIAAGSPVITPADQTFTVLYVEPDNTLSRPLKVWMSSNHKPDGTIGELKGYAERGQALNSVDVNIDFTAYSQQGQAPMMFAQAILKSLSLTDLRPTELVGITNKIDPFVQNSQAGSLAKIKPSVLPIGSGILGT